MEHLPITLTEFDKLILEEYCNLAEGLGEYLGDCYELVVHSFSSFDHSVIKIVNNHSGRKEGSPITDFGLKMLSNIKADPNFRSMTYYNKNVAGKPLKSCTNAIKGKHGKVIGMLCINFYLDSPLYSFMESINPDVSQKVAIINETLAENVDELISEKLTAARERVFADRTIQAVNRNREIIFSLYSDGIFNMKDSVVKVASILGISKNTVYMHIRNFKNQKKDWFELFNNQLSSCYYDLFKEMQKGFNCIEVDNDDEKVLAINLAKFLCIYPYVKITVKK